jgi:hypothetical protein
MWPEVTECISVPLAKASGQIWKAASASLSSVLRNKAQGRTAESGTSTLLHTPQRKRKRKRTALVVAEFDETVKTLYNFYIKVERAFQQSMQ